MKKMIVLYVIALLFGSDMKATSNMPELRFVHHSKRGPKFALHFDVMKTLKKLFNITAFIETGTYHGRTTLVAARCFQEVHTIELSQELFEGNKEQFALVENISAYQGDSADVLPKILPGIQGKKLIFLDGHFMGGESALGSEVTPIFDELNALAQADDIKNCILLIDDMRLFRTKVRERQFFGDKGYPVLHEVIVALQKINPHYIYAILGDSLLVFDASYNVQLSPILKACTQHRLNTVMASSQELKQIESIIAQAKDDEFFWLKQVADYVRNAVSGFGAHYQVWYALALLERKHYPEALEYFNRSIEYGYVHPHIFEYMHQARDAIEAF